METVEDGRVPVTLLTGFPGADETTLSNRVLTENHSEGIAVAGDSVTGVDPGFVESRIGRRTP